MVSARTGFSAKGDPGAAVVNSGEVIGIVVGSAGTVPGCPSTISYVQDIDTISGALGCAVIP